MHTHAEKTKEKKHQSVDSAVSQKKASSESALQFVDNRPEGVFQRKFAEMASGGPQVSQLQAFQTMADNHPAQQQQTIQKKENNTGLPDNLKTGMENLSGMALDDVKVHRNSDKPAQLQAHAYAQGTDIHLGPGQEKHLPHEAWHVVQQKQGRVNPTMQMKAKVNINDDSGLEKEADVMGAKAVNYIKQETPAQSLESPLSNTKQLVTLDGVGDSVDSVSTTFDNANEVSKLGTGGAALAEGTKATDATKGGGVFADLFDAANAFKNTFQEGKDFWQSNPKDWGAGANAFFEGSKGIMAVVKGSIDASGAGESVKESAGKWVPGIGAAISAFQNVMSMFQNQTTWELVKGLDNGTLNEGEKKKVSMFVKRLDAKLGLDLVDFIWNIAELIATFGGPSGPAVALVHGCYNLFKGACELTHGYFAAKGLQADQRITGGKGDVDQEQVKALDLHLKESKAGDKKAGDDDSKKPSKSIFDMIKSYGSINALKLKIGEATQQTPPDDEMITKDRESIAEKESQLKLDLVNYNTKLKPKEVGEPGKWFSKTAVPDLKYEQIGDLYKIHMNVIKQIIGQAKAGLHGYAKLKSMTFGVEKDIIYKALQPKLSGFDYETDMNEFKLLSKLDASQSAYFEQKTIEAIHTSSNRTFYGDEEIQDKLQEVLIDQKDKFLPILIANNPEGVYKSGMTADEYKKVIEKNIKF